MTHFILFFIPSTAQMTSFKTNTLIYFIIDEIDINTLFDLKVAS